MAFANRSFGPFVPRAAVLAYHTPLRAVALDAVDTLPLFALAIRIVEAPAAATFARHLDGGAPVHLRTLDFAVLVRKPDRAPNDLLREAIANLLVKHHRQGCGGSIGMPATGARRLGHCLFHEIHVASYRAAANA